ncbi:hypothetical protein ABT304_09090 [Nocardioides sp. NPDC000445]|uniref:hypothetical protein n=1 Tax=Nocardioides sp. NPDC000445 TaxID=3154257 RepID=UPI00331AE2F5
MRLQDVVFFLSGHVEVWKEWPVLPADQQVLITELLRLRDADLANATVVRNVLRTTSGSPSAAVRLALDDSEDEVDLALGRPALEVAHEWITTLRLDRSLRRNRTVPIAQNGVFTAPLHRGKGARPSDLTQVTYDLTSVTHGIDDEVLEIGRPANAASISVRLDDLRRIARTLDDVRGTTYRTASLEKIFDNLETRRGHEVDDRWTLTAGPMEVLHAPTGFGKSVLTELLACWAAENGQVMTILVTTNAGVIKTAHSISRHLADLGLVDGNTVVPLTSPKSAQRAAETAAAGDPSPDGHGMWALQTMAYGCALTAAAASDGVDAWEPGQEPCTELRPVATGDHSSRAHDCPWIGGCGKFRNVRAAASATVVVTTFHNWLSGIVPLPVKVDGNLRSGIPVEEMLLRRSHIVLIDEVDEFQATMIKGQAGRIVLEDNRPEEPVARRIWSELRSARNSIDRLIGQAAHTSTGLMMHLAENYVQHLAAGDFARLRATSGAGDPLQRRWLLPQKWDGFLTAALAGLEDDEPAQRDDYAVFQALVGPSDSTVVVPAWLEPVRDAVAAIQVNSGDDAFELARALITQALAASPHERLKDDALRARVTDRLLRRAYFGKLRDLLTRFIYLGPALVSAGVVSAREISDTLSRYKQWRAAPLGPLGRTLFAFSEVYDEDRPNDSSLTVNAFGGDPHTYVPLIGETTALAHTGIRRCVLGLSATSFFPGAPHHHVFTPPTWWVPDSATGGLKLISSPVPSDTQQFIRVSGTAGQERRNTMRLLGLHLWTRQLEPELRYLASREETVTRQRLLLATSSYEGARDLADGISQAGVSKSDIVVAVPPNSDTDDAAWSNWQVLPADQLERFGKDIEGKILIAPLARAARGINMADDEGRSLLGSVWLIVRPVPIIDEPQEILAHVHAATKDAVAPSSDPGSTLELIKQNAAKQFDELFNTLPYFSHLPRETRISIVAETIVGIIQLAGRARRGGTVARIHLVDGAFNDAPGGSGLRELIDGLRRQWNDHHEQPLPLLQSLYGDTLTQIFEFADERTTEPDDWFDEDHE